jgi:hypothetical protein
MAEVRFVPQLPDLIHPDDYDSDPNGRRLRLQIRATADGVEVLGDAMRPVVLEQMLAELDPDVIEQMLCG